MPWRPAARATCALVALAAGAGAVRAEGPDAPSAERGRQLYNSYCARCHGLNMVVASSAFFDLRTLTSQEQERFERAVNQGLRAMPAWGGTLKSADVQSLWLFVMAPR